LDISPSGKTQKLNQPKNHIPQLSSSIITVIMASIADELLNDFESDNDEDENQDSFEGHLATHSILRPADAELNAAMELDPDDEEEADDDNEQPPAANVQDTETEEEARARVEKMDLAAVGDVRSVASLIKTLQPLLDVSISELLLLFETLFTTNKHSPDAWTLTENRPLPDSPTRPADQERRIHRRQPRVQAVDRVQHAVDLDRW
jgi:hypothetical protein